MFSYVSELEARTESGNEIMLFNVITKSLEDNTGCMK
jgi:hypothetical protein